VVGHAVGHVSAASGDGGFFRQQQVCIEGSS